MAHADRTPHLVLALLLAAPACKIERSRIETPIAIELVDGDDDARERLVRIELDIWPATSGSCRDLSLWRRDVCGDACTDAPSPRDRGETPDATAVLARGSDGAWIPVRLPAISGGPWELAARGFDDTGEVFLHGCRAVSSGMTWTITMWRPWCDVAACAGQFHPACDLVIDCANSPTVDDPDGLSAPVCQSLDAFEWSWEQNGVACPPRGGSYFAPCRPALVVCEQGILKPDPDLDGVCPREEQLTCGASPADDLDCDGVIPGPCEECNPARDTTQKCLREDGVCEGLTECGPDERWGECVFTVGPIETCDGEDTDCDGIGDGRDPDAIASCNVGRPRDGPIADGCSAIGCSCGGNPVCAPRQVCRGGVCSPYAGMHELDKLDGAVVDPSEDGGVADDAIANDSDAGSLPDAELVEPDSGLSFDAVPIDLGIPAVRDSGIARRD